MKMLSVLSCSYLFLASVADANNGSPQKDSEGIRFEKNMSWQQVLAKAKMENKYIFLDFFATWCGPCKKMDKEVYPNDTVGNMTNDKFLSVRVQIDTSASDNNFVRSWYADAHVLVEKYQIYSYPSFLFFSPDGKLVHRGVGYMDAPSFISLASDALDTSRQMYTLLDRYGKGERTKAIMVQLMQASRAADDGKLYEQIGADYTKYYLDGLAEKDLLTKDNINMLFQYTSDSKQKGFDLFYRHPREIDSVMGAKTASTEVVDRIVYKEEVHPALQLHAKDSSEINWDNLYQSISIKYDSISAGRVIAMSKIYRFKNIGDYKKYVHWLVIDINKYMSEEEKNTNSFYINNATWDIFFYSTDKEELKLATLWAKNILERYRTFYNVYDTYANLLYKQHQMKEALIWEEKAARLSRDDEKKAIMENYSKMKAGQVTWYKLN